MTRDEFFSTVQSRGMQMYPGAPTRNIATANTLLQEMRAAMIPTQLQDFFAITCALENGNGYIFGPSEISRGTIYPIPSIIDINRDMSHIQGIRGKTIFGRNDLFFFAFDAFGIFYMLDNLSLRPLRKYNDMYHAMTDCLMVGKI